MRRSVRISPALLLLLPLSAAPLLTSCSKSGTVLALTVNLPSAITTVTSFAVTVTPTVGGGAPEAFTIDGTKHTDMMTGKIMAPFFERFDLDSSGNPVVVKVVASDCGQDIAAGSSGDASGILIRSNETTAVAVTLAQTAMPLPACHGGAGGAAGTGGASGGAGGGNGGGAGGSAGAAAAGGAHGGAGGAVGGARGGANGGAAGGNGGLRAVGGVGGGAAGAGGA